MQTFCALGAPPPDPRASDGWGSAPRPPASGIWGFRPQTPVGLGRLGAPPPETQDSSPHNKFLATRLGVHLSAGLHLNSEKKVLQFW